MMTREQFGALMKQINAADPKFKLDDKGKIAMWARISAFARWEFHEAEAAVAEFYAMPADPNKGDRWIDPGNITYLIRARRGRHQSVGEALGELTTGRTSTPEHRARLRAELDEHIGRQSRIAARKPFHDGPVDRPTKAIDPARVRALASGVEGIAATLARKFSANDA